MKSDNPRMYCQFRNYILGIYQEYITGIKWYEIGSSHISCDYIIITAEHFSHTQIKSTYRNIVIEPMASQLLLNVFITYISLQVWSKF